MESYENIYSDIDIIAMSNKPGRFIIVDKNTREILDDAHGYGYKSIEKAHSGWAIRHTPPETIAKREETRKKVQEFCFKYPDFCTFFEGMQYMAEQRHNTIYAKEIRNALKRFGISEKKLGFPLMSIAYYFGKIGNIETKYANRIISKME